MWYVLFPYSSYIGISCVRYKFTVKKKFFVFLEERERGRPVAAGKQYYTQKCKLRNYYTNNKQHTLFKRYDSFNMRFQYANGKLPTIKNTRKEERMRLKKRVICELYK